MASFIPPEQVVFTVDGGVPVIRLSGVSVDGAGVDGAGSDGAGSDGAGSWGLLNRLTLVVVDGPGDHGFLLARMGADGDAAPAGWDEAVAANGGAWVEVPGAGRFQAQLIDG